MLMTSNKPYILRAIYEWIVDNNLTPYILVNTTYSDVQVPQEHVANDRIILNISPNACRGLHLGNDRIVFTARFSSESMQVVVTPTSVLAIYAKENGKGMEFMEEVEDDTIPPSESKLSNKKKPVLTLVKKEKENEEDR